MPTFYRAVSAAEYEDIDANGALRAGPNSVEGKHLVGAVEHALAFATLLYGEQGGIIVSVELSSAQAERFFHFSMPDGIGPAWFAELDDLKDAIVRRVTP